MKWIPIIIATWIAVKSTENFIHGRQQWIAWLCLAMRAEAVALVVCALRFLLCVAFALMAQVVSNFANEYYDGEDDEESLGNFVPEEDVLKPHVKPRLTKELQAIHDRMIWVFEYFSGTLVMAKVVSNDWNAEGYGAIWDELLMMEPILRAMAKPTGLKNTLQDDSLQEGNKDYIVKTEEYNLHLVLNIIGVMMEQGVVTSNISATRKLFFPEQSKDKYLNPNYFKKFGKSDSAFASEVMYKSIVEIINKHKIEITE